MGYAGDSCRLVNRAQSKQVGAGGCNEFLDDDFNHFCTLLFTGLFNFHAMHSRKLLAGRLLRKRRLEVTRFDLL